MSYHYVERPSMSCAIRQVREISHASTPEKFCRDVYEKTDEGQMSFGHKFRFVMFSHYSEFFDVCEAICKFVEDNKLGTIMRSSKAVNPNTNNTVCIYIWEIDWAKYDEWYQGVNIPKKRDWKCTVTAALRTPWGMDSNVDGVVVRNCRTGG